MSDNVIQTSFNSGEWSPSLYAQVNLKQYHSGAALLRNFFIDTRGGATTRPGTEYIATCKSNSIVRPIPFQASFTVSYLLEFGQGYVRFFNNGAPVLEAGKTITAITQANPGVITSAAHGYINGDWIVISGIVGMVLLNGNTFIVVGVTANTYTLTDLFGNVINTTSYGTYISGGITQRVYTITSPYQASEVFGIRYTQNVNQLILCHPNHPPSVLTLITATNWTIAPIAFGSTVTIPTVNAVSSTLAPGTVNYAYVVTAFDSNGQESGPSTFATLPNSQDLRTTAGTNTVSWGTVTGAISYAVYKAELRYGSPVPAGSQFGFIGAVTGLSLIDSNISPDFTQGPPIPQNPFSGSGVQSVTVTNPGSYGGTVAIPSVSFSGGGGSGAAAIATLSATSVVVSTAGSGYVVGDTITIFNLVIRVTSVDGFSRIQTIAIVNPGALTGGTTPPNPYSGTQSGSGLGGTFSATWGVSSVGITNPGTGYATPPAVAFSSGAAAATAILGATSAGNPTVPALANQRLVLAGPVLSPGQINASKPGAYFNFDISSPIQPDDAIQQTLVAGQLNTIQAMIPMPAGLIVFGDRLAWLVNGGSAGAPFSATSLVANPQAYNGSSLLPPIVATSDILYVQAKQSIVRNLVYNFYTNVYTGTDISILSNHLFYAYNLVQWAWAEEPFKLAWAVRNDGQLLCLTFLKDLEIVAWTHSDTQGSFAGVASIVEPSTIGNVDAIYHVVQRTVQGVTVNYIERFVELSYPNDYKSSWQVDAGIGYNDAAATIFSGAQHLGGMAVTGLADGVVINFTMPVNGIFQFGIGGTAGLTAIPNASIVTVGLSFLPQLGTLPLDLGEPTVQGKRKKVSAVTVRCRNALGLTAGRTLTTGVPMQDLILGNVGTMSNQIVTGLVTGDARTIVDPQWDVFGQYYIQQPNPYPASILGVIPEIEVGDSGK